MKEKLRLLMESEQLRSGQLAEQLGINPAAISHLLSGRNKPGFDLLQRILRRFSRINPDWLLLDRGPMYRTTDSEPGVPTAVAPSIARPAAAADSLFDTVGDTTASSPNNPAPNLLCETTTNRSSNGTAPVADPPSTPTKAVRIVVFYDDRTYESFSPRER